MWGVLVMISNYFHKREFLLRNSWSEDRIMFRVNLNDELRGAGDRGQDPQHDDDDEDDPKHALRKNFNLTNEAMTSDFFFAYQSLLVVITEAVRSIEAWMLACPCHPEELCKDRVFTIKHDLLQVCSKNRFLK